MSDRTRTMDRHPGPLRPAHPGSRRVPRRLLTKGRVLAAVACLIGGAIVVNAVVLQNEKHPAPLFRSVAKAPDAFPVPPSRPDSNAGVKTAAFAPAPLGAARPAPLDKARPAMAGAPQPEVAETLLAEIQRELGKRGYYKGDPDGRPGPMTTQAIRDFQFANRVAVDGRPSETLLRDVIAARVTMKEELLDLVKRAAQPEDRATRTGIEKTTAEKPVAEKTGAERSGPEKTIADVQRALNKAGYGPLAEDGQMGPSTKQALAKFEADRKLPPRGEPKGPVLKVLASASGIPISQ